MATVAAYLIPILMIGIVALNFWKDWKNHSTVGRSLVTFVLLFLTVLNIVQTKNSRDAAVRQIEASNDLRRQNEAFQKQNTVLQDQNNDLHAAQTQLNQQFLALQRCIASRNRPDCKEIVGANYKRTLEENIAFGDSVKIEVHRANQRRPFDSK